MTELTDLPWEILTRIFQIISLEKGFKELLKLQGINRTFGIFLKRNTVLWSVMDLAVDQDEENPLRDHQLFQIVAACALPGQIQEIKLSGNVQITAASVLKILGSCIRLRELDIQHCYRVDILQLEKEIRSILHPFAKELECIRLLHSGYGSRYYCRNALEREPFIFRRLILDAASSIQDHLRSISGHFELDPYILYYLL